MYIKITANFSQSISKHNMRKALIAIGKHDPMGVKRYYLFKIQQYVRFKSDSAITDKDYLRRGILNIRKKLNSNLGKSGKFSNNMIFKMLFNDVATTNNNRETVYINYEMFISIVRTICVMLYNCDAQLAEELLLIAQNDRTVAGLMRTPRGKCFKTVAPAPTNEIIAGTYIGAHKEEADNLSKMIVGIVGHVEPSK